jgi:hypothetical protein
MSNGKTYDNLEKSQTKKGLRLENLQPYPPFSATNQPSPEAKKAGWKNRKARQLFFEEVLLTKFGNKKTLDIVIAKMQKLFAKGKLNAEEAHYFAKTMEFFKVLTPDLLDVAVEDKANYIIEITPKEAKL